MSELQGWSDGYVAARENKVEEELDGHDPYQQGYRQGARDRYDYEQENS